MVELESSEDWSAGFTSKKLEFNPLDCIVPSTPPSVAQTFIPPF